MVVTQFGLNTNVIRPAMGVSRKKRYDVMTNGEKFKTAQEREVAYTKFLLDTGRSYGKFEWLDIEFEEEKPMPCPFCGEETFAYSYNSAGRKTMYKVCCKDCSYHSKAYYDKAEAIASHDRICKAVDTYKESEVK